MKTTLTIFSVISLVAVGAWMTRESGFGLNLQHGIGSQLRPYRMITALAFDGVGEGSLFVDPVDKVITPWIWSGPVWEPAETKWFVNSLRAGDVVVEVGENVVSYTVLAGLLVGDTGRVYACERDPVAFEILRKNVGLSGLDNVVVEQKAVSNEPGAIRLYLDRENRGDRRIYQLEGEQRESVDVEGATLDDRFADIETSVDFVEIDTQGAELAILQWMLEFISGSPAIVMALEFSTRYLVSFGSTGKELLDVIATLERKSFNLGMGGSDIDRLDAVSRNELLRRFSPTHRCSANRLLVRGHPGVIARIDAQKEGNGR